MSNTNERKNSLSRTSPKSQPISEVDELTVRDLLHGFGNLCALAKQVLPADLDNFTASIDRLITKRCNAAVIAEVERLRDNGYKPDSVTFGPSNRKLGERLAELKRLEGKTDE